MFDRKSLKCMMNGFLLIVILIICSTAYSFSSAQRNSSSPTEIPREVIVRIFSAMNPDSLTISGDKLSINGVPPERISSRITIHLFHGTVLLKVQSSGTTFALNSPVILTSDKPIRITAGNKTRITSGKVAIRNTGMRFLIGEAVPFETYIAGVVDGEMPGAPLEAGKAQAIAARSFALYNLNRHWKEGYHFCDSTHCQFYRGILPPGSPAIQAARETQGMVLLSEGKIIEAFFHSTCAGSTATGSDVFGKRTPGITPTADFLPGNGTPLCRKSPHYEWTYETTRQNLTSLLKSERNIQRLGEIVSIKVTRENTAGRVKSVLITGKSENLTLSGYQFWQMMGEKAGWGAFKSAFFKTGQKNDVIFFRGKGLGHGLGMCQYGAMELANKKNDFRFILKHYYPEARITRLPGASR